MVRRWARGVVLAGVVLVASGCSGPFPPSGITLVDGIPTVFFKFCSGRVIGRLRVGEVTKNDFDHPRIVWTAKLADPTRGSARLTVTAADAGYIVVDHLDGGLGSAVHYMFVDAVDQNGVNIMPTVNDFHGRDLKEGVIREDGRPHDLQGWIGPNGPKCH